MRGWALAAAVALAAACTGSAEFSASSIGMRRELQLDDHVRYMHRDSGVGFVMPAAADEGEREEDDAGFERVVILTHASGALFRVVVLRPVDGSTVPSADALTRLADGLIRDQQASRDEMTMTGTHAARRLTLPHADANGHQGAFFVTADDRALVMMEVVAPENVDALADPFFATLELGCDR